MNYTKHKFNIFPDMLENDFKMLKQDIETKGYDNSMPITLFQGKIIDGWHRYKACEELQIKPVFVDFKGSESEAIEFIMRTNKRRNLTSSQWATIAVEAEDIINVIKTEAKARQVASLKQNKGNTVLEQIPERNNEQKKTTVETVAEIFNTNAKYIQEATKLKKEDPELYKQVQAGTKTITEAKKDVKENEFKRKIEIQRENIKQNKIKGIKGLYDCIVLDPPWNYGTEYNATSRRVASPYPEMTQEELLKIKLPANENCIIFLWTTQRFIWEAKELLDFFGFSYKNIITWDKDRMGIGSLFRMQTEFCLVGTKGNPLLNNTNNFIDIIREKRGEHSAKPESFYKIVEDLCIGTKLEYFSRKERQGWEVYGDEVGV